MGLVRLSCCIILVGGPVVTGVPVHILVLTVGGFIVVVCSCFMGSRPTCYLFVFVHVC